MSETKSFEQILEEDGVLVYKCRGFSMRPLLRQNRDLLVIHKPVENLKKYDIVLFKTENNYVLHRIVKIDETTVITAGDHNTFKDPRIRKDQIIGVLTSIVRDGKEINLNSAGLKIYGHLVADLFQLKAAFLKIRHGRKKHNIR